MMKVVRSVLWTAGVILAGYFVAWTFGLVVVGPLVLFFLATGRIRIKGYWNLVRAALRGRVIILLNHPTLFFETFVIGGLLFPWYLIFPQCFVWSLPDKRLLDDWKMPAWIRVLLRCIQLDRSRRIANGRGGVDTAEVLKMGWVVVGHPEMGRTLGEANRHRVPLQHDGRVMQKIASKLTLVADKAEAAILPGWVDVPYREPVPIMESFRRMFGRENQKYWPIVFSFSHPAYRPGRPFRLDSENDRLQHEIFSA